MLFSKMVHHGFVVDLGHEMTQIVPIKNGHVSYHKCCSFPVGSKFIDAVYQTHIEELKPHPRANPFFKYLLNKEVKEKLVGRLQTDKPYILPDGTVLHTSKDSEYLQSYLAYFNESIYY